MLLTVKLMHVSRTMGTCRTFSISQKAFIRGTPSRLLLCIEILGIKIRESNLLHGFHFNHHQKPIKLAQYADDCILFINNKTESYSALTILERNGPLSGLLLHTGKCESPWLGKDSLIAKE